MTKTREKKVVVSGVTADQMETAFADFARADARIQKINATMDVEMTRIREKYQDELSKLQDQKDKAFDVLQTYGMENQAELFSKKKSIETVHGIMGFRTGTPKLKTLKGFTWASALQLVKKFLPGYVRQTEEIAKDKLLADRDIDVMVAGDPLGPGKPVREQMAKCGITVVQDETFYVEPKKEEV